MSDFWENLAVEKIPVVLGTVAIGGVVIWAAYKFCGYLFKKPRKVYPRDVVILHHIGRGPWAPSMSPFPLKLETYLKMANIPYQAEGSYTMSSKGKTPWITYNDEDVADSQFCIEYLNKKFNVDQNKDLSKTERAIARAFQKMAEENIYWAMIMKRWVYNKDDSKFFKVAFPQVPLFILKHFGKKSAKVAYDMGIGRHSKEEVHHIYKTDLTAISDYLGDKRFFMGPEPSEVDCSLFGILAQLYLQMPQGISEDFKDDFPNLVAYCERMKERFWPDWDECITHGGTKEATK